MRRRFDGLPKALGRAEEVPVANPSIVIIRNNVKSGTPFYSDAPLEEVFLDSVFT
jgi:hypothetical protein